LTFESLGLRALETARTRGAAYADIRFEDGREERVEVRNGIVASLEDDDSSGFGIRAFVDGAWGFAAGADLSDAGVDATAARAVEIARAGASVAMRRLSEAPGETYVDRFITPLERDPEEIGLHDRVALLLDAESALHASPKVSVGRAWIDLWRTEKEFYSTTGSRIAQSLRQTGCGITALAVDENDAQNRTYPGDVGFYQSGGWEVVEAAALRDNAERIGEEAAALLTAEQCPQGEMDVVLGSSQMSLQIHESCGHAAELDRIMGWEANFSGVSFLDPSMVGTFRYGSDHVTIVVDNTLPRGLATVGYDDEGSRSVQSDIVRAGVLMGFEMSRDTARAIGTVTNACVRAESWQFVPMIRMCNLNLLPGETPFAELFDPIKRGVYMESNRSWSIDDHRLNFQFGCQIGWEIRKGKRGRMVKNPTYAGVTPRFWRSCDAVADARSWVAWGTPNCGKGEPMQAGRTAQCAAPARFRNVNVGAGYRG
jgi:TldD protein